MGHRMAMRKREMKELDGKEMIKGNFINNKDGK